MDASHLAGVARRLERRARRSDVLRHAVGVGLVGYGLVHLLVAWATLRVVLDAAGGRATGSGAMAQVAVDPGGRLLLGGMALGFAALAVWQVVATVVGYRGDAGPRRWLMRVAAAARAVMYGYLAVAASGLVLQGPSGQGSPRSATARLLALPAGPWLLGAVAVGFVATGTGLAVFGARRGFVGQLDERAREGGRRVPIVLLGVLGYLAKGAAITVVGVLLGWVALSHDPRRTGGLDQALHQVLGARLGTVAVVVVGLGLACFGLYLIARARHLERRSLTS